MVISKSNLNMLYEVFNNEHGDDSSIVETSITRDDFIYPAGQERTSGTHYFVRSGIPTCLGFVRTVQR